MIDHICCRIIPWFALAAAGYAYASDWTVGAVALGVGGVVLDELIWGMR